MNTRLLLSASALFLGILGILGSFLPQEILAALSVAPSGVLPLLVQLLAALLFAFAMLNWVARGSLLGGIYNRPVATGNAVHFVMGALALAKGVAAGQRQPLVVGLTIAYALFAAAFLMVFFRSPVKPSSA